MSAPTPPRIKRPRNDQFRHYCFECSEWTRDVAQDVRFYSMSGAWPIESDGYCWQCGRMSAHTQACVLFDGSK